MGKKEKFLSLDWFKERVEEAIEKAVDSRVEKMVEKGLPISLQEKPYLGLKLVNDSLTIVLRDGFICTKPNATEKDYIRAQKATSVEELLDIIEDKEVSKEVKNTKKEAAKLTAIAEGFNKIGELKDFRVEGKTIVFKASSRTIPPLLLEKFTAIIGSYGDIPLKDLEEQLLDDNEYQGLKNFFMWCCLNPRAEVADSLYNFLHKNGMKITKQGFFVALRNVVDVQGGVGSDLIQFVSNAYNKVKAVWKKNPKDFTVIEDAGGNLVITKELSKLSDYTVIGNLKDLYLDLPNMNQNRFTDNWTKTFDIRIGQVVSMPSAQCDWSTQDCARAGLHFAGHTAPYVLCGDTTVFTLHNPMKVVGIGSEKGRCWEYLPFMTTTVKEADQIMNSNDFDFLQLDEHYAIQELEGLVEKAKEGFTTESSKYEFNLPSISTAEINSIVLSLGEMKDSITKRVSLID